jgi:hypothetical protein
VIGMKNLEHAMEVAIHFQVPVMETNEQFRAIGWV